MTRPRSTLVSVADTPYYHVIARCVRRAFLCGDDRVTGQSFDHRRAWLLGRLKLLTETFAIDLCAYALMSNHYHLVVRIDVAQVKHWSARDVTERWCRLFSGPTIYGDTSMARSSWSRSRHCLGATFNVGQRG